MEKLRKGMASPGLELETFSVRDNQLHHDTIPGYFLLRNKRTVFGCKLKKNTINPLPGNLVCSFGGRSWNSTRHLGFHSLPPPHTQNQPFRILKYSLVFSQLGSFPLQSELSHTTPVVFQFPSTDSQWKVE